MNFQKLLGAVPAALVLSGVANAELELLTAKTSAVLTERPSDVPTYVDVSFNAELTRLEPTAGGVVITWNDAGGIQPTPFIDEASGIDPTPFQVFIPESCFRSIAGSMQVVNYRSCGVKAKVTTDSGFAFELPFYALTAVMTERRGYVRLSISASIGTEVPEGDVSNIVLGKIGGSKQSVVLGRDEASLIINSVDAVGFNP